MTDNHKALAIVPRNLDEVRALGAMLVKSALLPPDLRGKEADVIVSVLAGLELGMTPMAALRGVHVVKGKPVLAADSMVGVVLGRGVAEYFACVEESNTSVTYETKRAGAPHPQRCTWTMEDAQRAGIAGGDNWKKYPRPMLKARCKAMLARDVYPDVLAGCYDDDEGAEIDARAPSVVSENMRRFVASATAPVADAEIVESPDATPVESERTPEDVALVAALRAIDATKDRAELEALAPSLQNLDAYAKTVARSAYKARRDVLRAAEAP